MYRPRRPTATPLYRVVQHHLETFLARAEEADPLGYGVPGWVERDFRAYLPRAARTAAPRVVAIGRSSSWAAVHCPGCHTTPPSHVRYLVLTLSQFPEAH